MPHNARVESLSKKLTDHLEQEVKEDPSYKILWLVRHLEQYLERWLAFAQVEKIGVDATLNNETFYVVLAATRVINNQVAQLSSTTQFPREEWDYFRNTLEWIQKAPDRSELGLIKDTFESFNKKLPNGDIEIDLSSF